jgi:hypothetical protein
MKHYTHHTTNAHAQGALYSYGVLHPAEHKALAAVQRAAGGGGGSVVTAPAKGRREGGGVAGGGARGAGGSAAKGKGDGRLQPAPASSPCLQPASAWRPACWPC